MSDQRSMRTHPSSRSLLESQNGIIVDLHKATTTLPLLPFLSRICAYLSLSREIVNVIYHLGRFPLATPRGLGKAVARLLHCVFTFTILLQFILSGMSGVTSHLASQAHTVARNTHSITLAVCALPLPFKNLFCAGISDGLLSPRDPNVDRSLAWHPFLINEDIHGPAVDFAIRKATNATSVVLSLVRASDLSQRHELSDKLKDFIQRAWASELSSGSHVALVKTVIDEMLLEHDAMFAKLRADLHPGLLSRLIAFNWAHRSKQAILEALAVVGDATTAHARRLVMHGESVYHDLRFLESISLEISGLLAVEGAAVKREKEEIISKMLTFFGGYRGALRILEGRGADLHYINNLWREARDSLSLGIHAFNGVRSDLTALSEHQTGPKTARLHVPVDKQDSNFKGWVGRIEARRVLTPAQVT
ncbi:hypothetical protein EDB89DRAFT_1956232 [Lactarius sanguifluus]|nr:hypothetical protein EDB89DRAFT_1956232 [Lactarius sanguifluus]